MSVPDRRSSWKRLSAIVIGISAVALWGLWLDSDRPTSRAIISTSTTSAPTTTRPIPTTTRPIPTTTRPPPFTTVVVSPFTASELDFLNALSVAEVFDSYQSRVSAEGVDLDGNGRTDVGWHVLVQLELHSSRVGMGRHMCDLEVAEGLRQNSSSESQEVQEAVSKLVVIARAYLC